MAAPDDLDGLVDSAGRALSRAHGTDVVLALHTPLRTAWGRHRVLLATVDDAGGAPLPRTVVVKAARERTGAVHAEHAALALLAGTDAADQVAPLLAADLDDELLVLADLGDAPSLHRVLQSTRPAATVALHDAMRLLARVHVATRGCGPALAARRAALPDGPAPAQRFAPVDALMDGVRGWTVPPSPAVADELAAAAATLAAVEPCLTFDDACAVNRVVTPAGVRAFDLEMADVRHPLVDGAWAAIGHLRCSVVEPRGASGGIALPPDVRRAATAAYREAVVEGYPVYADADRFDADLVAAGLLWLATLLGRAGERALRRPTPRRGGLTEARRARSLLAAARDLPDVVDRAPATAAWAATLATDLQDRWPGVTPLDPPAAFRPTT